MLSSQWTFGVSIRRADYWLVEGQVPVRLAHTGLGFQSAGRIIGWLKAMAHAWC